MRSFRSDVAGVALSIHVILQGIMSVSAMVEPLVYACNDNWDFAWELMPEDDYLTGRIENYDEITHQVVDIKNIDGRPVRGVLYFVRLHTEIAEISRSCKQEKTSRHRTDDSKRCRGR